MEGLGWYLQTVDLGLSLDLEKDVNYAQFTAYPPAFTYPGSTLRLSDLRPPPLNWPFTQPLRCISSIMATNHLEQSAGYTYA